MRSELRRADVRTVVPDPTELDTQYISYLILLKRSPLANVGSRSLSIQLLWGAYLFFAVDQSIAMLLLSAGSLQNTPLGQHNQLVEIGYNLATVWGTQFAEMAKEGLLKSESAAIATAVISSIIMLIHFCAFKLSLWDMYKPFSTRILLGWNKAQDENKMRVAGIFVMALITSGFFMAMGFEALLNPTDMATCLPYLAEHWFDTAAKQWSSAILGGYFFIAFLYLSINTIFSRLFYPTPHFRSEEYQLHRHGNFISGGVVGVPENGRDPYSTHGPYQFYTGNDDTFPQYQGQGPHYSPSSSPFSSSRYQPSQYPQYPSQYQSSQPLLPSPTYQGGTPYPHSSHYSGGGPGFSGLQNQQQSSTSTMTPTAPHSYESETTVVPYEVS